MKRVFLILLLFTSVTFAEETTKRRLLVDSQTPEVNAKSQLVTALESNYEITLKMTDKDGSLIETALVTSSPEFRSTLSEQHLGFGGTLFIDEEGVAMVKFTLEWTAAVTSPGEPAKPSAGGAPARVLYQTSTYQGSIRLKDGEEVQILRTGARKATLSVKKLVSGK